MGRCWDSLHRLELGQTEHTGSCHFEDESAGGVGRGKGCNGQYS